MIWFLTVVFMYTDTGSISSILTVPRDPVYNTSEACETAAKLIVDTANDISHLAGRDGKLKIYTHCDSYNLDDLKKLLPDKGPSL